MRGGLLALLVGALLLVSIVPARAASAWSVAAADDGSGRANFSYQGAPGTVIEDAWLVTNTGDTDLRLQIYATDAITTAEGQLDLLAGGQPPTGLGAWVEADVDGLVLAPGEAREVGFTLRVPPHAAAGDYLGGIVSVLASAGDVPVAVERRLGTRISMHIEDSGLPTWLLPAGCALVGLLGVGLVVVLRFSFKQAGPRVGGASKER